jgi:hypothetical protein
LLLVVPASADWEYGNDELDLETSWTADPGSSKSATTTITTAEIVGTSASSNGANSPNASNLDRRYRRVYTKVGNPDPRVTPLKLYTNAAVDTGSSNPMGSFSASAEANAESTYGMGLNSRALVNQSLGVSRTRRRRRTRLTAHTGRPLARRR